MKTKAQKTLVQPAPLNPQKVIVVDAQLIVTVGVSDGDQVGQKFQIPISFHPLNESGFADAMKLFREKKAEIQAQVDLAQ